MKPLSPAGASTTQVPAATSRAASVARSSSKADVESPRATSSRQEDAFEHDSRGRHTGTPDDSTGRHTGTGTPDDSTQRNKGTPDDSTQRNHGTPDDSTHRHTTPPNLHRHTTGDVATPLPASTVRYDGSMLRVFPEAVGTVPVNGLSLDSKKVIRESLVAGSKKHDFALVAFHSAAFRKMSADERTSFVDLFSKATPHAAGSLTKLLVGNDDPLHQVGSDGTSTLTSLTQLSTGNADVFNFTLADLANPGRIMQGTAPTCTVTSMQYELAHDRPGEYARLMASLGTSGTATMAGGGQLSINVGEAIAASVQANDGRSASEAVFQAAAMEYANGTDQYDLVHQQSHGAAGGDAKDGVYAGLFPRQITAMIGQLFGATYSTTEVTSDEQAKVVLSQLPTTVNKNRPILMDLDMGSWNHAVAFEGVANGKVLFHDPETGARDTMTVAEFLKKLTSVHRPSDLNQAIIAKLLRLDAMDPDNAIG